MKSFKRLQYHRIPTEDGIPASGDYIFDNVTVRLKNGYLNDCVDEEKNILPAVEIEGGSHIEHWRNGVLHCVSGPAIKDTKDDYEEWYQDGKLFLPGGNNGRINDPRNL